MPAITTTQQESKNSGYIMPLIALGLTGIALWKGIDWFKDWQSQKETEKAQASALKHELNIKRTQERINAIERKAIVSGVNANKKTVTVNIINQANEIINSFFVVLTDKHGTKKYILKADKNINAFKIKSAIFSTPLKSIGTLQQVYSIYTGRNLLNDCQKLPPNTYTEIKTVFEFAAKKYGK